MTEGRGPGGGHFSSNTTVSLRQTNRAAAFKAVPPETRISATPDYRELLSCFDSRRDQTYVIDTRLVTEVDHLSDLVEVEVLITLDEHHLLLTSRKDLRQ